MISPGLVRARLVVAERGHHLAIVLAIVGIIAFVGVGTVYAFPPTETVVEPTHVRTVSTQVTTSAPVTAENFLWERGTVLENMPYYPIGVAPEMTLRVETSVPAGQSVPVTHGVELTYQASRKGALIWESTEELSRESRTVRSGRFVQEVTVDARNVRSRYQRVSQALPGAETVRVFLQLNVSYQTDRYTGAYTTRAEFVTESSGYWLSGSLDEERTHSVPTERRVTKPPEEDLALSYALLGLLALTGAGGVEVLWRRSPNPDRLRHRLDELRFEEWISYGDLPAVNSPVLRLDIGKEQIHMRTIADLVDVAIDSNDRVIYDPGHDLYAVLHDDVIFYHVPDVDVDEFEFSWQRTDNGEDRPDGSAAVAEGSSKEPGDESDTGIDDIDIEW